ncbi:MAG: AraC family transcriptional regulator ligand-binding domain-containing protein, partial [Pseudomonadota bacterium]
MPGSTPTHGAVFVQTLARDLLQQGYTQHDVFGGTGLTSDLIGRERPFVPFDRIAQFFEHAARLTGNDALGFERGAVREMRRSGLICYVGLSAPTVLDFIKNIARYRRVFSDAVEVNADRLETDGQLEWYFSVSSNVERRQYVEFGASGLLHAMRQASGERFCPR